MNMNMSARKFGTSWWVDFRHRGERYRKRSPDNSKAGTQAYEAVLRDKLSRGQSLEEDKRRPCATYEVFASEWVKTYVQANCKPSEVGNKAGILKLHLVPWFGKMPLNEITTLQIEQYKAAKIKKGLSTKTVNNHLATLSKSLSCAFEWGKLAFAHSKIKRLKMTSGRTDFLSPIETHQLLQDHSEPMWNAMILVALRTGMRFGELLGLDWQDIDWERKIITVRQSLVRGILGTPKSGKIRHIPMALEVVSTLADMRRVRGFVFSLNEQTHRVALNAIHRICKRSGVRKVSWHILRHTFASHLAMEGVPIPVVQQLLGHSSIVMTMRYAHLSPSKLGEAVAVFQALEKREVEKFGQQVGNAIIKRTISESPTIKQIAEKMA